MKPLFILLFGLACGGADSTVFHGATTQDIDWSKVKLYSYRDDPATKAIMASDSGDVLRSGAANVYPTPNFRLAAQERAETNAVASPKFIDPVSPNVRFETNGAANSGILFLRHEIFVVTNSSVAGTVKLSLISETTVTNVVSGDNHVDEFIPPPNKEGFNTLEYRPVIQYKAATEKWTITNCVRQTIIGVTYDGMTNTTTFTKPLWSTTNRWELKTQWVESKH